MGRRYELILKSMDIQKDIEAKAQEQDEQICTQLGSLSS